MESALIISSNNESIEILTKMFKAVICDTIVSAKTCGEARRILIERDFDICIISSPLADETGEKLSKNIASKGLSQIILIVNSEIFEEVSSNVEDYGVITISKPINKALFWNALKLANAAYNKMKIIQKQDKAVAKKIEDIKTIDKAKRMLINYKGMTEQQAHRYIEKQAMDLRITKKIAADGIIKIYEN